GKAERGASAAEPLTPEQQRVMGVRARITKQLADHQVAATQRMMAHTLQAQCRRKKIIYC
ncbi:MAG: hypothetical protein AAF202_06105, partial [Pseudomonadota bacterium]